MLGVKIVCVGNLKEKYLKDAAAEYIKRLSRFCDLEITETPESTPQKEKDAILKNIKGKTVALCVEGKQMPSEKLAEFIEKTSQSSPKITFVIGGSDGLDEEVKSQADLKLSFSEMTFPHQLMRIILLEQIYRAFTIINNIKYHK
ncbi:MAG: 23S rRNA (pseudouridine(1915)-N(3))-methyltransferase RlmH [Clostridia bacterium]|nr:23S rRNA (pseudouridine(1915)-N(3))-methyltransferase RlmH [Clostridia bacterium]